MVCISTGTALIDRGNINVRRCTVPPRDTSASQGQHCADRVDEDLHVRRCREGGGRCDLKLYSESLLWLQREREGLLVRIFQAFRLETRHVAGDDTSQRVIEGQLIAPVAELRHRLSGLIRRGDEALEVYGREAVDGCLRDGVGDDGRDSDCAHFPVLLMLRGL